jgi:predicted ATPase
VPYFQALIAEVCNNRDEAEALLDDCFERVEKTGERWIEAELYRVRGDVRWSRNDQAEACYRRALMVACNHGARLWELRAALCLARLWWAQGRLDEARAMLKPICDSFTEGSNMRDLRDAKALQGTGS